MEKLRRFTLLPLLLVLVLAGAAAAGEATEEHYYAIELNGTLGGYAHVQSSPAEFNGKPTILVEQRMFMMLSALGSEFNTEILLTFHLDPATRQYVYYDADIEQGRTKLGWTARIEGDMARVTSILEAGEKTVALPPDVILADTLYAPYLKKDFIENGAESKTYEVFEARDAEVQQVTYTLVGNEAVELAGRSFDAVMLDGLNLKTGVKSRMWIDRDTAQILKGDLPNNRTFYLTDAAVVKKIELVNLDENLTARVNVSIPDIQAITRMDAGMSAADVGRELEVNQYTLYRWKRKYGGLEVSDAKKLRQLQDENARLKRMVADQALDLDALKVALGKSS